MREINLVYLSICTWLQVTVAGKVAACCNKVPKAAGRRGGLLAGFIYQRRFLNKTSRCKWQGGRRPLRLYLAGGLYLFARPGRTYAYSLRPAPRAGGHCPAAPFLGKTICYCRPRALSAVFFYFPFQQELAGVRRGALVSRPNVCSRLVSPASNPVG
ncbi:hypothetical protein EVAR_4741_1 [Eumeta japonica]|uniref:Secreted protein n=1 Tax=Eumeta variegata TaxID=151549 RepID=A0A4C1T252_EUMVA|nr:hypothetical protein EVAR_4741_1 [Eumeta japonica]